MKTFSMKSSPQSSSGMNRWGKKLPLCEAYPVNSIIELTLEPNGEVISGLVYCTDDVSNSIVLKRSHRNTPVTSDVQIVNVSSIRDKKIIRDLAASTESTDTSDQEVLNVSDEISVPILVVSKKEVEEIEKRAAKIAEETFHHINQKATPEGQSLFQRLLKACNEVVWSGEAILVLNQIRVDPPYGSENCVLFNKGGDEVLNEGSLERVKRIVSAPN